MPPTAVKTDAPRDKSVRAWLEAGRPGANESRRLLALAKPHAWSIAGALVLLVVATGSSLAVPWLLAGLLNGALADPGPGSMPLLNKTIVAIAVLYLVRAVCHGAQGYLLASAGEGVVVSLRRRLYGHLTSLEPAFFDRHSVGELVSRTMSDVALVQAVVTSDVAALLAAALTMVGAFALLVVSSWRLALIVMVLIPPVVITGRLYARRMRSIGVQIQDLFADATRVVLDTLGAIRLVQSFGRETHERQRFSDAVEALEGAAVGRARVQAMFGAAVSLLTALAVVAALWFGGREVLLERMSVGGLVAFVAYSSMIASSAASLVALYGRWANALGASRRVFALLDRDTAVADRPGAREIQAVEGRLSFEGVSFGYGRGGPVLIDVDLEVAPGETLALVGPSGAGKSTMIHLIARFYDPQQGCVTIDGLDLRDASLASLRRHIGLVPQETALFNASVMDNVRYGRLDASDAEVEQASRAAHAHGFVEALPEGYATIVGERGVRLSAGERQRVAIARALLKDARVLLLDEATSSLDSESEGAVQAAFERLLAGRTSVVIAHRLSTVRRADRIAVLDAGRIVELGRHEELLDRCGLYARLHDLQFRDPDSVPSAD